MDELFKIYVDRLRHGEVESFDFEVEPHFLELGEGDLKAEGPVKIEGNAYLAEHELVINGAARATFVLPCQICNEPTKVEVDVHEILAIIPHEELKSGVFDMGQVFREEILLQVPQFVECHDGKCPERASFSKFMSKEDEGFKPFKGL